MPAPFISPFSLPAYAERCAPAGYGVKRSPPLPLAAFDFELFFASFQLHRRRAFISAAASLFQLSPGPPLRLHSHIS